MLLLCGATGDLGGRIARRLVERGVAPRVLVRPAADASVLEAIGAEIARGDLRDPGSLDAAAAGVETVVTTVTAMGRRLGGEKCLDVREVDGRGNQDLIAAAERAGVRRFVFVSAAELAGKQFPLARAKCAAEARLRASRMREVIVRPGPFQEIWLGPVTGVDLQKGRLLVYGKGEAPATYVATDDVAEATVRLALADDAPRAVDFGGPDPITRNEIARLLGLRVRRVPRLALRIGARALASRDPALASVMGLALTLDLGESAPGPDELRRLGIEPRPARAYLQQLAASRAHAGAPSLAR